MQLKKLLEKWDLTSLKIKTPFLEMPWEPEDEAKTAARELYVELITRAATQGLDPDKGNDAAALKASTSCFRPRDDQAQPRRPDAMDHRRRGGRPSSRPGAQDV